MKKIIFIFLLWVFSPTASGQTPEYLDGMWDRANTAYINSDFSQAIVIYDSIANAGYMSKKLYYNMGNAWFKNGGIGKAILYYNKALKIDPSDSDTKHNLQVAGTYVKDRIETVPEFFLTRWIRTWGQSLSTNQWAWISLISIGFALGFILLYLLSGKLKFRKRGFYCAVVCIVLAACAAGFSISQQRLITNSEEAVILSGAVPVKSSPDTSSKDIFILHEGTKVRIVSTLGEWYEIMIQDGNKGWIRHNAVELI